VRAQLRVTAAVLALALGLAVPLSAQPVARRAAVERATSTWTSDSRRAGIGPVPDASSSQADRRRLPRWVRWGLVGAAAGAVTFPLLGGLGGGSESRPARDAAAGAISGFVVIGGSVALWDAVCAGDTRSRRAGMCGHRMGGPE
jgi:hypothetical protein